MQALGAWSGAAVRQEARASVGAGAAPAHPSWSHNNLGVRPGEKQRPPRHVLTARSEPGPWPRAESAICAREFSRIVFSLCATDLTFDSSHPQAPEALGLPPIEGRATTAHTM